MDATQTKLCFRKLAGIGLMLCLTTFVFAAGSGRLSAEAASGERDLHRSAQLFFQAGEDSKLNSPDTAEFCFRRSISLFRRTGDKLGMIRCYESLAALFAEIGRQEDALKYADTLFQLAKDLRKYAQVVSARNIQGAVYLVRGDFDLSSRLFYDALRYVGPNREPDDRRLSLYNNLVILLKEMNKYEQALHFANKSYATAVSWNLPDEIAYGCNNIVEIDIILKKFNHAEPFLYEMGKLAEHSDDVYLKILNQMQNGCWNLANGNYAVAVNYFHRTLELNNGLVDQDLQCVILNDLGMAYQKLHAFDDAEAAVLQALELSFKIHSLKERNAAYHLLTDNAELQKDYEKAFKYSSLYKQLSDSLLNEKSQATILELEARYQSTESQKKILLLNKEKQLSDAVIAKQKLISNSILLFIVISVFVVWILFNQFKLKKRVESQQALINERKRISADLHDDIGSGLSKISLLSELVKQEAKTPEAKIEAEKISQTSKELAQSIGEIIWTLNFNNDYLENLVAYIRRYAFGYFENAGIGLEINMCENIPQKFVNGEYRRNIFLAVKEVLHNIVKHASASRVVIDFSTRSEQLTIEIRDNGKGFPTGELNRFGNGIVNIQNRITRINGTVTIENQIGTKITLRIPI